MEHPIALVTGAGIGIGRGIAMELAKSGFDVAVHCNSSLREAEEVCSRITAAGCRSGLIQADLSQVEGIDTLFRTFSRLFGRLDLFVHNSGITRAAPLMETSEELFDSICNVNLKGSFFCVQRAAIIMAESGVRGNIVIVSSNHSRTQISGCSVYGSIKAALNKYVRHAAMELSRFGIRVNAVAPGFTDTGASRMGEKEPTYYRIPLKRWCTPEEIGQAVLFLSSPFAASITGECIVMDGGASLQSDRPESYGL